MSEAMALAPPDAPSIEPMYETILLLSPSVMDFAEPIRLKRCSDSSAYYPRRSQFRMLTSYRTHWMTPSDTPR